MTIKRLCKVAGCNGLAEYPERYCPRHLYLKRKDEERNQLHLGKEYSTHFPELYSSLKWKQLRQKHLREEPLCRVCGNKATEVDHLIPHQGDINLFFNEDNLQSLCHNCHSKKTIKEMEERKREKVNEYQRIKRNNIVTDNYKVQW